MDATTSLWEAISIRPSTYPELTKDIEVDVAIVGGGITGVTAAMELIAAGKKVAILEAHRIGGYTTGNSTGNLYIHVQPFYQYIVSKFDLETAKAIAHARKSAIDYIEKIVKKKGISCNFSRRPWYGYVSDKERISFSKEVETYKKMDITVESVKELPLPFPFKKGVMMANQARCNPLQYVISVAENLAKNGCLLFEKTRVTAVDEKDVCTLSTEKGKITAKKVILATHTPIGINLVQMYTAPYRSYVVAARLKKGNYPEGHFMDFGSSHYISSTHAIEGDKPDLLLAAGSHHKTGQGENMRLHYEKLKNFLFDTLDIADLPYQWSAQHYQSADNIPYIGLANRFAKHTYMATGYFADGLVYGTIAGALIADSILEKHNSLEETFQSNRFKPIASAGAVLKENKNVLLQYLKDYPLFTSPNFDDIKAGQGKVVEINQEKCAVSRDDNDKLHVVSAVCTHMKCLVAWNNAEQTWDCPCHGSRFTPEGTVLEGPAEINLEKKEL